MKHIFRLNGEIVIDSYLRYLSEMEDRLPPGVRAFMLMPSHYAIGDARCPHDSWLDAVNIVENGGGDRGRKRQISIDAVFLGSYHDGYFRLKYRGVSEYSFSLSNINGTKGPSGHGDWIVDEALILKSGQIVHEIEFSQTSLWRVVCDDIEYTWDYA